MKSVVTTPMKSEDRAQGAERIVRAAGPMTGATTVESLDSGEAGGAKGGRISRTTINYWVDFALLVNFLLLWWSTLVLRFVFPPGAYALDWKLWGWNYTQWLSFQFGVLIAFSFGVLLHLMLHWTWVCSVTIKIFSRRAGGNQKQQLPDDGLRTLYGVIVLIVALHIVGLAALAARLTIQGPPV